MNKKLKKTRFGGGVILASAAAVLFTAHVSAEGAAAPATPPDGDPGFQRVDKNSDDLVTWRELDAAHGPALLVLGMDQELVMALFDEDGDAALNAEEFPRFQRGLRQAQEQLRGQAKDRGRNNRPSVNGSKADTADRGRRTLGGGNVKLSAQELEKAIIDRSFDRAVRSDKLTKVQAGSSVFSEAEAPVRVDTTARAVSGEQQDGTAVIVVDGQVIASTEVANPEPAPAPEVDALDASGHNSASQVNAEPGASMTLEANDPRSIYAGLKGTRVVNSSGETIGVIEGLVVNSDTGKAGLVVSAGGMGTLGGAKVLAPLTSVAVTAENVVWQTAQSFAELDQSNPYEPAAYIEIAPER